jgi:predicted dehydrogenase
MADSTLSIGVIGLRNVGKRHCRQAAASARMELVAGADTDPDLLARAAEEFGLAETYSSAEELIERSKVDAVVVALPNFLHAPVSIAAMEAGKDVLVEKPIARNATEAREMLAARDRTGRRLIVGMNQRFQPLRLAQWKLIAEGAIGDVYYAKAVWLRRTINQGLYGRGRWGFSHELAGGGPLLDIGIHMLDLVLFLMGFPRALTVDGRCFYALGQEFSRQTGRPYAVEDMGVGIIRCEDGQVIHFESGYFANQLDENIRTIQLFGTRGGMQNDQLFTMPEGEANLVPVEEELNVPESPIEHFAEVCLDGAEPIPTAEQGLEAIAIVEAMYESSQTGRRIDLGLGDLDVAARA